MKYLILITLSCFVFFVFIAIVSCSQRADLEGITKEVLQKHEGIEIEIYPKVQVK